MSDMEVPELRALGEKYNSGGGDGDTEMKCTDDGAARAPFMVVNNDNGVKTVLRSTRKAAKASAIMAPAVRGSEPSMHPMTASKRLVSMAARHAHRLPAFAS